MQFAMGPKSSRQSDGESQEPDPKTITDFVQKNPHLADKINVIEQPGLTRIDIDLAMSFDNSISADQAQSYIDEITKRWNVSVSDAGHTYEIATTITNLGPNSATYFGPLRGDLHVARCSDCSLGGWAGAADLGGRRMYRYYGMRPSTPAHEFGHSLGLNHQPNATGRMMSYARVRSVGAWEAQRLAEAYRR